MTDKQIKEVFKNGFYCIEPCPEIKELQAELKAKEQECKELKNIINEAKNSKLDLNSFLVGEAVQKEYEQQLDQLKAENDELKKWKETVVELFERTCRCKYLNEENNHCGFYNRKCIGRLNQCLYKNQQALTEIKEIVFPKNQLIITDSPIILKIQEKISEVEDG